MTAQEKIQKAFQSWIENEDPPPTGMDLAGWLHVVRQHAPCPITAAEVNEVGREHWGPLHWPEQKPEDWDDNEESLGSPTPRLTEELLDERRTEDEFKEIHNLFNKLHAALLKEADVPTSLEKGGDVFTEKEKNNWLYLATSVDALHHDFAELVS